MQINSTYPAYQSPNQTKLPQHDSYTESGRTSYQLDALKDGGALQATAYQGTAFDNAPELVRFMQKTPYGGFGDIMNINLDKVSILDAEKVTHTLESGKESTNNINLYKESMIAQGSERITKAVITIDDTFVALQTIDGDMATPFRPKAEHEMLEAVSLLMEQSNGDFNAFIDKLEVRFGDRVSVESYEDGEGPDYAEAHALLNDSTWDDFVGEQTENMFGVQSSRVKGMIQRQESLVNYNASSQSAVFTVGGVIVANEHSNGIHIDQNNLVQEAEARGIEREQLNQFFTLTALQETDSQTMKDMLESVFSDDVDMQEYFGNNMPTGVDITEKSRAQYISRFNEIANLA